MAREASRERRTETGPRAGVPVGDVIGLIRWFPLEGEWQHELITGPLHSLDERGRIVLGSDDEHTTYHADTWAVCSAVPEPLRGLAS